MSVRNLLKAGELIAPVPIGVLMTLQYNREGNIEKVYTGIGDERVDVTKSKLMQMITNHTVPSRIHIKNGTTFVEGVLYTGDIQTKKSWDSAESLNDILFAKYSKNPEMFNFFGANIKSLAVNIAGSINITRYLKTTGFNVLNGFILSIGDTDALIKNFIDGDMFPFMKVAMGYYAYGATARYVSGGVHQHVVHEVDRYTDINGFIKCKVDFKDFCIYLDYSDIVKYRISRGTTIILDESNSLVFCFGGKDTPASNIKCDCCGKLIVTPDSGFVQCGDPHCPSMLYPKIQQFMHKLGIVPEMKEQEFRSHIEKKEILSLSDVLNLPEYDGVKIHTSISNVLRAMIPYKLIGQDTIITMFVNKCTNSIESVTYYADHPDMIGTDLNITDIGLNRLVCWLSDSWNVNEFKEMLVCDKFIFDTVEKSFDGPPIFRGKKVYLTGSFIHGTIIDVCNIIQSYAATATTVFSTDVNCVLVGGMNEETDGTSLQIAMQHRIPVMTEQDFFKEYDIDTDLIQNGVISGEPNT